MRSRKYAFVGASATHTCIPLEYRVVRDLQPRSKNPEFFAVFSAQ